MQYKKKPRGSGSNADSGSCDSEADQSQSEGEGEGGDDRAACTAAEGVDASPDASTAISSSSGGGDSSNTAGTGCVATAVVDVGGSEAREESECKS
jgi:hypothetical protein